jgi:hypothetical protein
MEQLLAMNVAAILTQAACGSSGGNNNITPDLSDPQVRAKNLQAWETFRAYYQAVVLALNDSQDWPLSEPGGPIRIGMLAHVNEIPQEIRSPNDHLRK